MVSLCIFSAQFNLSNYYLGDFFQRRLLEGLKEALSAKTEYDGLDKSLRQENPTLVSEWDEMIRSFDEDKSKPCPYISTNKGTSNLTELQLVLTALFQ